MTLVDGLYFDDDTARNSIRCLARLIPFDCAVGTKA